jgi:hypothetical protein
MKFLGTVHVLSQVERRRYFRVESIALEKKNLVRFDLAEEETPGFPLRFDHGSMTVGSFK